MDEVGAIRNYRGAAKGEQRKRTGRHEGRPKEGTEVGAPEALAQVGGQVKWPVLVETIERLSLE